MKGAYIQLPRELIANPAWRGLSINARRFVDFLMLEHMAKGGKANGLLLAPWEQLQRFGIGARHVGSAIEEVVSAGIVDRRRGVGRAPNTYALTWLPVGTSPASDRWRTAVVPSEGKVGYLPKGRYKATSTFPREGTTGRSTFPSDTTRREGASKKDSYQGGAADSVGEEGGYREVVMGKPVGVAVPGRSLGKLNGPAVH